MDLSEMPKRTVRQSVTPDQKAQKAAEKSVIKGDYKRWSKTISYKDFVKHAETCYNTYMETANVKTLEPHVRLAFQDAAQTWKDVIDYIERQAK